MATETPGADDNRFKCSICIGIYKTPRYLPTCGHTFCEYCLLAYTRNTQQQRQGSKFHCPICRKANELPEHDEVSLQFVQTFPINTIIVKMMAESLPQSSEETKEERICDPCKEEGETNVGFRFCLDCKDILCKTCTKFHMRVRQNVDHKLVDMKTVSKVAGDIELFSGVGKCSEHPARDVEIYCKTHDDVICSHCSIFRHKPCDVTEICSHGNDAAKLQKDSEVLITKMNAAIEHLNLIQTIRTEIKCNFEQHMKQIRENIEKIRNKVVETMDNVVKYVSDLTKQRVIEREDKIDIEMSKVARIKELTEQKVALLDTVAQHGSEKHKFVSAHLVKKQFEETEKQISEEDRHIKYLNAELIIGDKLQKLIDITEVEKLVQIKVTKSDSSHRPLTSVSASSVDTGVESNVLRDCKLVKAEEHTVSSGTGNEPCYCGVAVCKDGRVILCDSWYYGSRYLHLYNPADRTQLKLTLPRGPFSAVQIDDTHLAVSMPGNKTISIVTVGDVMRVDKMFNTQTTPYTIVALNNGHVAVAWSNPPAFSMVDVSGTEIVQKSYMDQDTTGRKFKSFEYLAMDERRQHVIQPCTRDKAVYCFDLKGEPVFKYTHPGLTRPRGVALDRCGNIYVCEYNNNSIHKLSPTGDPISVTTEGVPSCPLAICSDVTGTGFWVTRYSPPYDQVVYFRLE